MRTRTVSLLLATVVPLGGCRSWLVDRTDRTVNRVIERRLQASLGTTPDFRIGPETGEVAAGDRMYSLDPRPVTSEVPESFKKPRVGAEAPIPEMGERDGDEEPSSSDAEMSPDIFGKKECDEVVVFGLRDTLAYAMRNARDLQDAKEDLYLAALDLTLERHLWTPQFVAGVQTTYDDYWQASDLDRAMSTVSQAAVTQRLPFGGEVSAQVIHSLVRDVVGAVNTGENGQMILSADIPLLRGTGRAARESRYTAERELVYAVRRYERFRRSFLVEVAGDYFNLQQSKAAVANTFKSYTSRKRDWEKADFIDRMGRSRTIFEAPRAKANLRIAEAGLVSAKERYESALDRFKILIGMPVDALLDVVEQDRDEDSKALDELLPDVDQTTAIEVALRYRLDLLNVADRIDDTDRGVLVAKNRILPDLDITGSMTLDSDPDQLRASNFRQERATWHAGVELRVDDRKAERNAYRAARVSLRRARRDYEKSVDSVRADVRRALRRIAQQENLRMIQELNVKENEFRLEAARAQYDLERSTNQDVVDAEDDLLAARNQYAAAVAAYRVAILELRRDTGTLRVTDDGQWNIRGSPVDRPRPTSPPDDD